MSKHEVSLCPMRDRGVEYGRYVQIMEASYLLGGCMEEMGRWVSSFSRESMLLRALEEQRFGPPNHSTASLLLIGMESSVRLPYD